MRRICRGRALDALLAIFRARARRIGARRSTAKRATVREARWALRCFDARQDRDRRTATPARLIDRVYCNPFAKLPVGRARYGLMLREDGFVYDDGTTSR